VGDLLEAWRALRQDEWQVVCVLAWVHAAVAGAGMRGGLGEWLLGGLVGGGVVMMGCHGWGMKSDLLGREHSTPRTESMALCPIHSIP
jgi:hypothetical protein